LVDGDRLPGLCLPLFGEGFVDLLVQLTCVDVGHIEQGDALSGGLPWRQGQNQAQTQAQRHRAEGSKKSLPRHGMIVSILYSVGVAGRAWGESRSEERNCSQSLIPSLVLAETCRTLIP